MRHFVWVRLSECKVGLRFDPRELGSSVQVAFPFGIRILSASDLAELGAILLALSDSAKSNRLGELFGELGLDMPAYLKTPQPADEVAERIVDAFRSGCPQLRDMLSLESRREDIIRVLAQQLAQILPRSSPP